MKFKSLLLRQRAASDLRLRRVFPLPRRAGPGFRPGLPGGSGLREREAAPGGDFPPGAAFPIRYSKG